MTTGAPLTEAPENAAVASSSDPSAGPSAGLTLVLALACGLIVANIYYAQPLVGLIGPAIGLGEGAASLVVTLGQIGYALGLLLLVPLGDRVENRRLVVLTTGSGVLALLAAATASSEAVFLAAALVVGLTSASVQMLVPIAAHLAPDRMRGRVVGNVMSGLILGILLARPAASLIAHHFGWRAVFGTAAALQAVLALVLWRALPTRVPHPHGSYGDLIRSLWPILRDHPLLQRRIVYQACLFGGFTLFWTAVPLELASPRFGLDQTGIAIFALCGASGAIAAPIAGRLADRGYSRAATGAAMLLALAAFALAWTGAASVVALGLAGIVLDAGVQLNQIIGQRAIYSLGPAIRSRVNGVYMAIFFLGGALGSALASPVQVQAGWRGVAALGIGVALLALAAFGFARRNRAR